ncbi:MAG: ATP-dependent Clp protease ATP-binding subunit [Deltaproteobacteria bacterium]|nr:ATP-dependent Clp protease ATP-binding subunit [Deltaproteobacteria bacterium]
MPTLPLRTLIAIETLSSGRVLAYPVVAPEHGSVGPLDHVLVELDLFLTELLPRQPPHVVSRFALPELDLDEARLTIELQLEDRTLPERLRSQAAFEAHCVVVPHHDGRWVLVPALRQTVYVAEGEDLAETVQHEVQARLDAHDAPLRQQLAWLPPSQLELEWLELELPETTEAPAGGTRGIARRLEEAQRRRYAWKVLSEVGRDVLGHEEGHPPVRGRDRALADLDALLTGEARQSVLLVGEPGVGKSAIVAGWLAQRREKEDDAGPPVFQTSGAQLIAGMSGMGQWQARLARVIDACDVLDAVLYLDDLGDLFDARGEAKVDLSSPLARAMEEGKLRLLGELDADRFGDLERSREAFFRNLQTLRVEPVSTATARAVLDARRDALAEELRVTDDALDAMISIGERFLPYRPQPGKVADLFDGVVRAARDPMTELPEVRARDVHRLFGAESGVPEVLLREDRALDAAELRAHFEKHLIGQSAAVEAVVDTLCVAKAGLQAGDKPLATFLFAGPTGVGKTELARALARFLYGSAERLLRFDMSEFADPYAAERLIRGTAGEEGELTRRIRQQPFAVVLLDEIEKAHPTLFDLLLQVTGEGRLTDARGRTAYFHDAIIVMTSNVGAVERRNPIGPQVSEPSADLARHYEGAVRRLFRPELVGRIDRIIPFAPLAHDQVRAIADLQVARIADRRGLRSRALRLEVAEDAIDRLVEEGHDPRYGARALRRELEERVVVPVAELIASDPKKTKEGTLRVGLAENIDAAPGRVERDGLAILFDPDAKEAKEETDVLVGTQALRRDVDELDQLPSVVGARERQAFLLAEMTLIATRADQSNRDIGVLQQEHHMLRERLTAMDQEGEAARALEEMAFIATLRGERLPAIGDEWDAIRHRHRMATLGLFLDLEPRHEITVLCQELDRGRTLDIWLGSLLRFLEPRGWHAELHFFKDRTPGEGTWPQQRDFGPPRSPEWALAYLEREDRDRLTCVVRLRGPNVGTLVGIECGLHRFFGVPGPSDVTHHQTRLMAMRFQLRDRDWEHSALKPIQPPAPRDAARMGCIRYTDERPNRTLPPGYVDVPLDQYWAAENSDELALRTLIAYDTRGSDRSVLFHGELEKPDPENAEGER